MIGVSNHLQNAKYLGSTTTLRRWLDPLYWTRRKFRHQSPSGVKDPWYAHDMPQKKHVVPWRFQIPEPLRARVTKVLWYLLMEEILYQLYNSANSLSCDFTRVLHKTSQVPTLKPTASSHLKIGRLTPQKERRKYSNHPFSGASCKLLVSGRVGFPADVYWSSNSQQPEDQIPRILVAKCSSLKWGSWVLGCPAGTGCKWIISIYIYTLEVQRSLKEYVFTKDYCFSREF